MNKASVMQKFIPQTKRLRATILTLSLLLILLAADMIWVRVERRIPIGYATTRLTGPLRPDGLVNYAAALDAKYGRGATAENNAVPLLIQATGVIPTDHDVLFKAYRKKLFSRLHIKTPVPKSGFHGYYQWVSLKLGNNLTNAQWAANVTRVDPAFRLHPWTKKEFPLAAKWVQANARAFRISHEAVKRPRYYFPLVRFRYINAGSEFLENFRTIAGALAARAMFRLGHGNTRGAVVDIDDALRLAALMSQSPSLMARLSAESVEILVLQTEGAAVGTGLLSRAELEDLSRHTLPRNAILPLTTQLNYQRYDGLAFLERASRYGIRTLIAEFDVKHPNGSPLSPALSARILDAVIPISFAATMRQKNQFYDQAALAINHTSYLRRKKALQHLYQNVIRSTSGHPLRHWMNPVDAQLPIMARMMPSFFNKFPEEILMRRRITLLAVALALYRIDHGQFSQKLSALVPHYIKEIPDDGFTGKPLKYRLLNGGQRFELYSVGPHGAKNAGKSRADGNGAIIVRGGALESK